MPAARSRCIASSWASAPSTSSATRPRTRWAPWCRLWSHQRRRQWPDLRDRRHQHRPTCSFDGRTRLQQRQALALSLPAACCHLFSEAGVAFSRGGHRALSAQARNCSSNQGRADSAASVSVMTAGIADIWVSKRPWRPKRWRNSTERSPRRGGDAATDEDAATRTLDQGRRCQHIAEQRRRSGPSAHRRALPSSACRRWFPGVGIHPRHRQRFHPRSGHADSVALRRRGRKDLRATASNSPRSHCPAPGWHGRPHPAARAMRSRAFAVTPRPVPRRARTAPCPTGAWLAATTAMIGRPRACLPRAQRRRQRLRF